ncbi:MAG: hypothetical protein WA012_00180 [Rhodoferax sp.]|jgi:hypothetical protein|uniref:AbiJ-NTD4 domain-containing protein n=1 Tax=Rhodoferax sp. TaxID=50421 RepID=UPI003BB19EED
MIDYFSDRENGPVARTEEVITPVVWAAIVATVQGLINSGAFGQRFPERCADGQAICGCDENAFGAAVVGEVRGLEWPLQTTSKVEDGFSFQWEPFAPDTLLILDFVAFAHAMVAKPIQREHHKFLRHDHLAFDQEAGQEEFRDTINRYFARNGLAFEMQPTGRIVRVLPPVIDLALRRTMFNTGDRTLDVLLEEAKTKFSDPNSLIRREALERLWDGWERLKSLADSSNKKNSVHLMLSAVTTEPALYARLDAEAHQLTSIGNDHLIRHYAVNQKPVIDADHVDYLFHRLFAMIQLMLKKKAA